MRDFHCHIHTQDAVFCEHEIMIDRRFEEPLDQQAQKAMAELSANKAQGLPSTVHCVRATKYMVDVLTAVKPYPGTVLWHGFNGSADTAAILYRLGVIISIGPRFNKDLVAVYKANPLFVLETDYTGTDPQEQKSIIKAHYENCARLLGVSESVLEQNALQTAKLFL